MGHKRHREQIGQRRTRGTKRTQETQANIKDTRDKGTQRDT